MPHAATSKDDDRTNADPNGEAQRLSAGHRSCAPVFAVFRFAGLLAFGGGGAWSRGATVPRKPSGSLMRVWVLCFMRACYLLCS